MSPETEAKIWEIKDRLYHLTVEKEKLEVDLFFLEGPISNEVEI